MTTDSDHAPAAPADLDDRKPRRWGWALLVAGVGGFLGWAALAPLDAGVAAPGTVVVSGSRQAVQPLVSGRVAALLARDGALVEAGQPLVKLDDTPSRSQLEIARGQWLTLLALEARLLAEIAGRTEPAFPDTLLAERSDARAASAMSLQTQLMATRRRALELELGGLAESQRGLELQAAGVEASMAARNEQLRSLREQLGSLRRLADEGFLARNRVLEQERAVAGLVSALAEDSGNLGRTRQGAAELRSRAATRQQEFRREAQAQLLDVQREIASLRSRLDSLRFEVANTEIAAPVSGTVHNVSVHTVGGVVAAGTTLMEIVPRGQPLRVEAQVAPHLVDKVQAGLPVDILFPAFQQATTPSIPGRLLSVSADVLLDPRQSLPYFKVMVEVTPEGMAKLQRHEIRPGMPAEVFLRVGERTALNYLLKPLTDRLNRALTEP
jgi:protease secretion system membrane fusion protein